MTGSMGSREASGGPRSVRIQEPGGVIPSIKAGCIISVIITSTIFVLFGGNLKFHFHL